MFYSCINATAFSVSSLVKLFTLNNMMYNREEYILREIVNCEYNQFCKDLREEATKRDLFGDKRASVQDWMDNLREEYNNHNNIWEDIERLFEKVIAIYELLRFDIGRQRIITMTTFMNFLETPHPYFKSHLSDLKSTTWVLRRVMEVTIDYVLDSFELSLVDDEADEIIPYQAYL